MPVTRRSMAGEPVAAPTSQVTKLKSAVNVKRKALGEVNTNRQSTIPIDGPIKQKVIEKRTIAVCRPATVNVAHAHAASSAASTSTTAAKTASTAASAVVEKKVAQRTSTVTTEKATVSNLKAAASRLQVHQDDAQVDQATVAVAATAKETTAKATTVVTKQTAAEVKATASTTAAASKPQEHQKGNKKDKESEATAAVPQASVLEKENIAPGDQQPKAAKVVAKPATAAGERAPLAPLAAPAAKKAEAKQDNVSDAAFVTAKVATVSDDDSASDKENKATALVSEAKGGADIDASMFIKHEPIVHAAKKFRVSAPKNDFDDLDEDDEFDPVMVAEYVEDCMAYMRNIELETVPMRDYMKHQSQIEPSMRHFLLEWIVEVHAKFHMLPETLFLCANLVDRFLSLRPVKLDTLQLVGIVTLLIAAKYEEIFCPTIEQFAFMADNTFEKKDILDAERIVLRVLKFDLKYPSPLNFLRRGSKADAYDVKNRTMAKYLLETVMMDDTFIGVPPSLTSAASLYLARAMFKGESWDRNLTHYAGYSVAQLRPTALQILYSLLAIARSTDASAVYRKYLSARVYKCSEIAEKFVADRAQLDEFGMQWKE